MTEQAKYLKRFFAKSTDKELVNILKAGNELKPVTEHFDGELLSARVAEAELQRRCDDHLSLFFDL
jgi:hypothetical protein